MSSKISTIKPTFITQRTNRLTAEQGYTYNEPGIIYNEPGVQYGGQYNHDISPLISLAKQIRPRIYAQVNYPLISQARQIRPSIYASGDIGTQRVERTLGRGMLIGMLGMTYKGDIVMTI